MTISNVNLPSPSESIRGFFFVIHNLADRCDGNRCADIRFHKQDGTSVVTHSDYYECCYYSKC